MTKTMESPHSTSGVSRVLREANARNARVVIPEQSLHTSGDLVLDLSHMRTIENVDVESRMLYAQAGTPVAELEALAQTHSWTLDLDVPAGTRIGTCLATLPLRARDKEDDPVDQLVAGLDVVLWNGTPLTIRPAPRRAVGPDLIGAFLGGQARLGVITAAHLVARAAVPVQERCFRFPDAASAIAALAWIRGYGVRPRHATIVAERFLSVVVDNSAERADAALAVIDREATKRQGQSIPHSQLPASRREPNAKPFNSPVLDQLAAELVR